MEDSFRTADVVPGAPSRGLWTVLLRRKLIILQVMLVISVAAMAVALLQPKTYSATGWMLVTSPSSANNNNNNGNAKRDTQIDVWEQLQNDLSMHIRLLGRREMAEAVIRLNSLDRAPVNLQGNFSASKVAGATANLLAINYRDPDPNVARKIVNAWGKAYEQDNLARRVSATNSAIAYVQGQIETVERQLASMEGQIALFEQRNLGSGVGPMGGSAATNLASGLSALATARQEKASLLAQIARARAHLAVEPQRVSEMEEQPTLAVKAMQEQLAQLHVKIEQLRQDYYEDSPEVTAVKAQIARLEQQLAETPPLAQTLVRTKNNPTRQKTWEQLVSLRGQLASLEAREQVLRQQTEVQRRLALGVPAQNVYYNELNRKVAALTAVQSTLLSRLYDLQLQKAMAVPAVQMVKAAELPSAPVEPPTYTIMGVGLMLGLLAGVILALVVDQVDDSFATVGEVDEKFTQRIIGCLPNIKKPVEQALQIIGAPRGPFANAIRMLSSSIRIEQERDKWSSLIITSGSPDEGKSLIASNLAVALAGTGQPVILVDGDLHKPVLHRLFGLPNERGLTSFLLGQDSWANLCQQTEIENLRLLTSGPMPPSPLDLLASDAGARCIRDLNASGALVIWDTPPASFIADTTVVGTLSDRVLLVVSQKAKRRVLTDVIRNLNGAGLRLLGLVTNQLSQSAGGVDDYYYQYWYTYEEKAPETEANSA